MYLRLVAGRIRLASFVEIAQMQEPHRIVSRRAERDTIDRLLRVVEQQGSAAALELVGEPSIGKTTLLDAVGERQRPGRLLLRGRAAEFESDLPYGLFIDAHLGRITERQRADSEGLAELAGVFPALERRVSAPTVRSGSACRRGAVWRGDRRLSLDDCD